MPGVSFEFLLRKAMDGRCRRSNWFSFGVSKAFTTLGVIYFILVSGSAVFMRNSPDGYRPAGWNPPLNQQQQRSGNDYTLGEALSTWKWYALWAILFFNTLAGISIFFQAAPLAQEVTHVSEVAAAGLDVINGLTLTAWDFAGVLGPTLIAHGRQS